MNMIAPHVEPRALVHCRHIATPLQLIEHGVHMLENSGVTSHSPVAERFKLGHAPRPFYRRDPVLGSTQHHLATA